MPESKKIKQSLRIGKRKKKRKKIKVRFFSLNGIQCQGRGELKYLKECIKSKKPISKPKRIKTPYGYYTPDFEHKERYVEVKSLHTFLVAVGEKSYIKGGIISNKQFKKMCWVAKNIKPLDIIIFLNKNQKPIEIQKYIKHNVKIIQRKK